MTDPSLTRAADRLIDHFERQILDGTLAIGQPLPPEREIVAEHGVSRTVVREAVLALSNKGLVRATPRFRPVVAKAGYDAALGALGGIVTRLLRDAGGVRSLFNLRILMEAALAREAAEHADKADIEKLETALAANEAAIGQSEEFYATDIDFHGVLYSVPGNPVLPAIHRAYTDWLAPQWRAMPRLPDRNRSNFEAHRRIFEAILRRDPDAAEAALRTHLDAAWQQVCMTFEDLHDNDDEGAKP